MSCRVAHLGHHPFPVFRFQSIFHGHAAFQVRITLGAKRNRSVCQVVFKRYVRRGDIDTLEVETRMVLQTIQDGGLHFFLRFQVVTAGGKNEKASEANW